MIFQKRNVNYVNHWGVGWGGGRVGIDKTNKNLFMLKNKLCEKQGFGLL